jgi:hypothetical protein
MRTRGEDILCGEIGAADAERWSAPLALEALGPADAGAIGALADDGILEIRSINGVIKVAGADHVGVVLLPSGRRLHVRPKVGDLVLLDWLAYLGESPPPSQWAGPDAAPAPGGTFQAGLALLFLGELETLTRAVPRLDYVTSRTVDTTVRGRVLAGALARGCHRLPAVPQSRRARSPDTPHNVLLASALDRLGPLLPGDVESASRWRRLRDEWAEVHRDAADLARTLSDARSASPPGYATAVQLACLLLNGCGTVCAASPSAAGQTFLLSLSGVWERSLRRMFADLRGDTGWSPAPDADRTRRWHDGAGLADPVRWMTADVLLRSPDGRRWVLDVKYKRDYGAEDRNDRFQASAYAMAFGADRGSLVYPTAEGGAARWRVLLSSRVGRGRRVIIDSIELPMAAGPAACRAALLDLITGRRAREFEQLPLFE